MRFNRFYKNYLEHVVINIISFNKFYSNGRVDGKNNVWAEKIIALTLWNNMLNKTIM